MAAPKGPFERFARQNTVLLTTHRRDGTAVGTPVSIVVEGDRAFIRTWDTAWKLRRMRRDPIVEIAPSTFGGRPIGRAVRARARILDRPESQHAGRLLARKYPFLHGLLVPLIHRVRGNRTVHVELTTLGPNADSA